MKIHYPSGEDGEAEITIEQDVIDAMAGLWKQCVYVKVLGRRVALTALDRRLRDLWEPRAGIWVVDLPRQFFMIRFDSEEDYHVALTGGPWKVFGSYLLVQDWTPEFDPLCDDIVTTPVWVQIAGLPLVYYHKTILKGITSTIGHPVRIDMTTLKLQRGRFARVCVEVDLKKPLKGTVLVNRERYFVAYEGLSSICSSCGLFGHLAASCPSRVKAAEQQNPGAGEGPSKKSGAPEKHGMPTAVDEEGFTVVHRKSGPGKEGDPGWKGKAVISGNSNHIESQNRFVQLEKESEDSTHIVAENGNLAGKAIEIMEDTIEEDPRANEMPTQVIDLSQEEMGQSNKDGLGRFLAGQNLKAKPKNKKKGRPNRGLIFGSVGVMKDNNPAGKRLRTDKNYGENNGARPEATGPLGKCD
ncbi:hypothetical protein V2J09_012672 [Rumex salicifolius]